MVFVFEIAHHWLVYKTLELQTLFEGITAFGRYAFAYG